MAKTAQEELANHGNSRRKVEQVKIALLRNISKLLVILHRPPAALALVHSLQTLITFVPFRESIKKIKATMTQEQAIKLLVHLVTKLGMEILRVVSAQHQQTVRIILWM